MYDIQNALRRRALAERLEALSHASEETERAAGAPARPRHLAGPPLDVTPTDMTPPPVVLPSVVLPPVALPPVAPLPPAQPGSPFTPAGGVMPTADRLLAVRTPEQPPPHDVPMFRADHEAAHLFLGADLAAPPGVTLLREEPHQPEAPASVDPLADAGQVTDRGQVTVGDLFLPPDNDTANGAANDDAPDDDTADDDTADATDSLFDVPVATTQAVPADAVPTDAVPTDAVPTDAVPTDAVPAEGVPSQDVSGDEDPQADTTVEGRADTAADEGSADEEAATDGASTAAAIADLLRRGGSGLFFQR